MIKTGFETRVKVQQIIESQLPEFILEESPKAAEFLKQYYISQEYQGGTSDISENLDQYLKLDNLTPEVVVDSSILSNDIGVSNTTIEVSSTKGFPQKYGLIRIDSEIITYTDITPTSFTGCVRGFSGITTYHSTENQGELVFETSTSSSHKSGTVIENLSSLFLREFYKKLKFSLTPGLEDLDFVDDLNVGNFIKEAKSLYKSKGTEESFKILFKVLYGVTPKVINLENYLIKPSSSEYLRREVVVCEVISGDPTKLIGQTIRQSNNSNIFASVSGIDILTRKGISYYQLSLFVGYDDNSISSESFSIPGKTLVVEKASQGSSVITVDSTIGFPSSGTILSKDLNISYTSKSINQFYGCSGVSRDILPKDSVRSDLYIYGYENGNLTKEVRLRLTGVVSSFVSTSSKFTVEEGDFMYVKNLGEIIKNPVDNKSYKEKIANSWIYNTSSRYQVEFIDGSTFVLKSSIDKSSLKVGDRVDILIKDSETVVSSTSDVPFVQSINLQNKQITLGNLSGFSYNSNLNYDIRRKLNKANSSIVPIEFGNNLITSDIQNFYNENDEYVYVASNSLPSYTITESLFEASISEATEPRLQSFNVLKEKYSIISFPSNVPFITGDEVYYSCENSPIPGLENNGVYYVQVLSNLNQIRLYTSKSFIGSINYIEFEALTPGSGAHNFVLNSQKNGVVSPQNILRKFPLSVNIADGKSDDTIAGSVGMLVNGVEISNYKSNDRIYYGPIESVGIINSGSDYDVINPPQIEFIDGSGSGAKLQPIIRGKVERVIVDPQIIGLDNIVSIALTGGNGRGASFYPVLDKRKFRDIQFSAKVSTDNGGIDVDQDTLTFLDKHFLNNGDLITYDRNGSPPIGVGTFDGSNAHTGLTLVDKSAYYCEVINDRTVRLYENARDFEVGINTVGFTQYNNEGVQKFRIADPRVVLKDIVVLDSGQDYENRKLIVKKSGISTVYSTVTFENHGFNDGDIIRYYYETSGISGLSTSSNYRVLKIDDNQFRICEDKTENGFTLSNYERKKYIKFNSNGDGYQYFKYPDIEFSINYSTVGVGTTGKVVGVLTATPIIRGEIIDSYLYESGSNYGSTILNFERKPKISIKNGKNAEIKPIVINGLLTKAIVQFGGSEYYSTPDLYVNGDGNGASLRPVIQNGKIVDVIVINPGIGYTQETTSIFVKPAGKNVLFNPNIRYLSLNKNVRFGDEIIDSGSNNIQYFVSGYNSNLQQYFNDGDSTKHSPLIGWAYDGNPIYGPYGYSDPDNENSETKLLTTGYELDFANLENRPSGFDPGFFSDDYRFTGSGDLDEHNGRFCKTPEFPNGVYAYFATLNSDNIGITSFPYFVGNSYRSKFIADNISLDQSFDFNNSNLIRNTFPYKIKDQSAGNDFIFESYDYYNQRTEIESVFSSSVDSLEIIGIGTEYKVNDLILFESSSSGNNAKGVISEVTGKNITNLNTSVESYNNVVVERQDENILKFKILPYHNLLDGDYVVLSGISTSKLSGINKFKKIGITSFSTVLTENIPESVSSGLATDIYVNYIPQTISIGSSIKIGSEYTKLLNIFPEKNAIRVRRDVGSAHTSTTPVYFIPDTFTVSEKTEYFDSKSNTKTFFKPSEAIGFGLSVGITSTNVFSIGVSTVGVATYTRPIQTQSLYIKDHTFKNNERVILRKPSTSYSSLSISTSFYGTPFNLPESGTSQIVYVTNKTKNTIGIKTSLNSSEIFFVSDGGSGDSYEYSLESDYTQVLSNVKKIKTNVSVSTYHGLKYGDQINLVVKPKKTVGVQTFSSVYVKFDEESQNLLVNPINFSSSGINTVNNQIELSSHKLKTGDKVYYNSSDLVSDGITTGSYYVHKVDDNNISLCETYVDSISNPPKIVSIASTGGLQQEISLINPELITIRNNNLKFDLSDSSLFGYQFKLYYDENFQDEFLSVESSSNFVVSGVGTIGVSSDASLTLNYLNQIPQKLFYAIKNPSGYISTSDKTVVNSSQINYFNSFYNGRYNITGVGVTSFDISLFNDPEVLSYSSSECDTLSYSTNSLSATGGISKSKLISSGSSYAKLPSFTGTISSEGTGGYVIAKSEKIGKINQVRITNQGFEYSSDKTLTPIASISPSITLKESYKLSSIGISSVGFGYSKSPELILVDSITREVFDSGLLEASLSNGSINSVTIKEVPYGLSSNQTEIISINNDNGFAITTIEASSGVATCYLETPILGFSEVPFNIGDKIFVEGIQNYDSGTGYNSSDNGYNFFTVSSYTNSIPAVLEFSVSSFASNPGVAKTSQNSLASIVRYNDYPKFITNKELTRFIVGEKLLVLINNQYIKTDLTVTKSTSDSIKIEGDYELSVNQKIKGSSSGSVATIGNIQNNTGKFKIGSSIRKEFGWKDDVGKLNDDRQVVPDNDYYQNLSYSINSPIEYDRFSVPVNRLLHTSGMKNFADTQIEKSSNAGIKTVSDGSFEVLDFINEHRVDEIRNFDYVYDIDSSTKTKFVKFKNKKLSSYVDCVSNRVLSIDDIKSRFSNVGLEESDQNIIDTDTDGFGGFTRYLIQVKDTQNTQYQLNEIIIIGDDENIFLLEKLLLTNQSESIGSVDGGVDDFGNNYISFNPVDPYTKDYDIKIISNKFSTDLVGLGSTSIGFINLTSSIKTCNSGISTSLVSFASSEYNSLYFNAYVKDTITKESNYAEIYLTHDGSDIYVSDYYVDSKESTSSRSFNRIGEFDASIENGIISLDFNNNTSNKLRIGVKSIGFGTTSVGLSTFRFKSDEQTDGTELTAIYQSDYSVSSGISTILSFPRVDFSSVKSVVNLSIGSTSALYQIALLNTGSDSYISVYQPLSIGNTSGIGTFGSEISGSNVSLEFYPDASVSSDVTISAFSELIYLGVDLLNIPESLEYGPTRDDFNYIEYGGVNGKRVERKDFDLYHNNSPIFKKTFNPSNSKQLNPETGLFTIKNHFFNTGEELIYSAESSLSDISAVSVGIGSTLNSVGVVTDILPSDVYPIKITEDTFKLATRKDYAQAGIYVTFTSLGSGNIHGLEMTKKLTKTLITIDDLVQYPVTYSLLSYSLIGNTGGSVGVGTTVFALSGISSIRTGDLLKVEDEFMRIVNVGYGETSIGPIIGIGQTNLVEVERGFVGTSATSHLDLTEAKIYRGSYNLKGNKIHFTEAPKGDFRSSNDRSNLSYFKSKFGGRVYLRKDYSTNQLYDDISERFTGIGQTYVLTRDGINTVGLGTTGGNGILFINNLFQTPSTQNNLGNNFKIIEDINVGVSSVVFSGTAADESDVDYISDYDVNINQLPRGGMIISLGSTGGLGYAPLVGASVTAVIDGSGTIISVGIGTTDIIGSGYYGSVSIGVTDPNHSGTGANITATVGAGGSLSFNIVDGGSGYVNPTIKIPSPSYSNLPVQGVSRLGIGSTTETGTGLLVNVDVSSASTTGIGSTLFEVSSFIIQRNGYGYNIGDVVSPVGLVTAKGIPSPISKFELTVVDIFTDTFGLWQFGELDYIDSIKPLQDGSRKRFPLYYNSSLLSFEIGDTVEIDLNSVLLIFVNGVVQEPGIAYSFEGGSSFAFSNPPKPEDNVAVFFYRGTRGQDSFLVSINETIKSGDIIQIYKNDSIPETITQNKRLVYNIASSDKIETNLYNDVGIDQDNQKPLTWTKQKVDRIINNETFYKTRDSLESLVYPTAKIIYDFNSTDTVLYVDDAQLFNYEENESPIIISSVNGIIVNGNDPVSAAITANVSSNGSIDFFTISNGGSGYIGTSIDLKLSAPRQIGVGIGTTATATASITSGIITSITITNPGLGYSVLTPPQVLAPVPSTSFENITGIVNVSGFSGIVTGISTVSGIGTDFAIKFDLSVKSPTSFTGTGLTVGYPIYIFDTHVGGGVTSIDNSDTEVVGIGTTFFDNIYKIHSYTSIGSTIASIVCNVSNSNSLAGIDTFGYNQIGKFSWGRLSGFTRSSSPISIGVTGNTIDVGLTTFASIQRRGYGLRNTGALRKDLG